MPPAIVARLRQWKPLTKKVILGLVRVATGAAAAAVSPEYTLLAQCLGATGEAVAEHTLDALLPSGTDERIARLLDAHADLIRRLEEQAGATATDDDIADFIRRALDADAALQRQFDAFAAGLNDIAGTLRRVDDNVCWIRAHLERIEANHNVRTNAGWRQYHVSIHNEDELRVLREVLDRLRQLNPEQQQQIDLAAGRGAASGRTVPGGGRDVRPGRGACPPARASRLALPRVPRPA